MSDVDAKIALETKFKNGWTLTPIKWPDVRFDIPVNTQNNPQPYVAYIQRGGVAEDIVLGSDNPEQRYTGIIMIQIFTPEHAFTGLSTHYADLIKTIYLTPPRQLQYLTSGIIRFYAPYAVEVGNMAGWDQLNVITPFKRDAHS